MSPKFKLRNYSFFWVSTFMWYYSTLIQTNFRFKRVLCFAIQDAWISRLLCDAVFSWRPGKLLCGLKTLPILEILLSKHSLSQNKYYFNLYEFLKWRIHTVVGNSKTDVSVGFQWPYLCPWKGHKHDISMQSFIILGKTFFWRSRIWNIEQNTVTVYFSFISLTFHLLSFSLFNTIFFSGH